MIDSKVSTKSNTNVEKQIFKITHPFHPLLGQEFEFLEYHNYFSGETTVYCFQGGLNLRHFPVSWTDLSEPDPFVSVSQGRSPLHIDSLLELSCLVEKLKEGGQL